MVKLRFSKTEIWHLLVAWIVISLAFGNVIAGGADNISIINAAIIAALSVGLGFIFHELSHKGVAQHYKCLAEFRANFPMLLLAFLMSFFGFVFAAPGAVMIYGHVNRKQNGHISISGITANLILAILFLPFVFIYSAGFIHEVAKYGFLINSILAIFNLIPFFGFDGKKVLDWNKVIYGIAVAVSIGFVVSAFLIG